MTTIVYHEHVLYADSRRSRDTPDDPEFKCAACGEHSHLANDNTTKIHLFHDINKMFRSEKILAIAGSGALPHITKCIKTFKEVEDFEEAFKHATMLSAIGYVALQCRLIVITTNHVYVIDFPDQRNSNKGLSVKASDRTKSAYIGSGARVAEAEFDIRRSPPDEAYGVISQVDHATGGHIKYVDLRKGQHLVIETMLIKDMSPPPKRVVGRRVGGSKKPKTTE